MIAIVIRRQQHFAQKCLAFSPGDFREEVRRRIPDQLFEFREIGLMITEVFDALGRSNDGANDAAEQAVGARVRALCARFPIYRGR